MKYIFEGIEYTELPKKLTLPDGSDISPIRDEAMFVAMGGIISEELTPKERVCASFAALIADLARQTDAITPAEVLAAAQNGISSDLIAFARERGVPEAVIAEGRSRIIEIMADAHRFGMNWTELVNGVSEA